MRVLYVDNAPRGGGAEIVLSRLVQFLGPHVDQLFAVPPGELSRKLVELGFDVRENKWLLKLQRRTDHMWPWKLVKVVARGIPNIAQCIRVFRPHLVHANGLASACYALPATILLKVPLVWHVHDVRGYTGELRLAAVMVGKLASQVIAVSRAVADVLMQLGIDARKISVIYNGIDATYDFNPDRHPRGAFRAEVGLDRSVKLVGFIGELTAAKGADLFIRSAARVFAENERDLRFIVVGDSPAGSTYVNHLRSLAASLGVDDKVLFLGYRRDIARILNDIDVLVHASTEFDALPTVILEAMAMGKPVVATEVGGVSEIVADGRTGLLCLPNQVECLARKVNMLLLDPSFSNQLGRAARAFVQQHFSWQDTVRRMLEIYKELAGRQV